MRPKGCRVQGPVGQCYLRLYDYCCYLCFFGQLSRFFWLLSLVFLAAVIGFCGTPQGPGPKSPEPRGPGKSYGSPGEHREAQGGEGGAR